MAKTLANLFIIVLGAEHFVLQNVRVAKMRFCKVELRLDFVFLPRFDYQFFDYIAKLMAII
ncbi:MAG: hypothetical protein EOP45_19750 [Sphingobacteriaceae bacterium]|nr:MAG: hypothetical protein EOP45_19750 [Sphingobacteriaceae bacterium]